MKKHIRKTHVWKLELEEPERKGGSSSREMIKQRAGSSAPHAGSQEQKPLLMLHHSHVVNTSLQLWAGGTAAGQLRPTSQKQAEQRMVRLSLKPSEQRCSADSALLWGGGAPGGDWTLQHKCGTLSLNASEKHSHWNVFLLYEELPLRVVFQPLALSVTALWLGIRPSASAGPRMQAATLHAAGHTEPLTAEQHLQIHHLLHGVISALPTRSARVTALSCCK